MRASEVMVSNPIVAVAGARASEVAILFRDRNVSVVPVVDDHRTRRFLGTLSDRDIVTRCLAPGKDAMHTRADQLMRTSSCANTTMLEKAEDRIRPISTVSTIVHSKLA